MDCPEENEIVDFARGGLEKIQRAAIEGHLDVCGACVQLVAEMARIFAGESHNSPPVSAREDTFATEGAFSPSGATLGGSATLKEQLLPRSSKLGRYVVLERIGAGGMGIVYAAYDPELDRKIALKVLRSTSPEARGRNDQRARLIREAQAMAKLSHPNVITVHDVGTFEDQVFIAMEYIDGGTLGDWLKQPRGWREILRVFRASGEGLQAAHAVGLVHRDFKPDNVLLDLDGRILVTDFGLARAASGNTGRFADLASNSSGPALLSASLTQTGALVGTPAYMAPEQLLGRATNALTDQFSFCVALYEALHGERPFAGRALVELVHNVSSGNVRPTPKDAAVPRWLRRAVLVGLGTTPQDRYPTMRSLLTALDRDPRRQWMRWGTVTIPTAVLGVGIMAYQQVDRGHGERCGEIPSLLAGVWDQTRQSEVEAAFSATSRPYAAEVFRSVKTALDAYAQAWVELRADVCLDSFRAQEPQAVLELRSACLSRRLDRFAAISDELVAVDRDDVQRALETLRALPNLGMCTDVEALTERAELTGTPRARVAAVQVDAMSTRAAILIAAEKDEETLKLAERIIDVSRAANYRRGEAEGLYFRGVALLNREDRAQAETAFHGALSASLAAGHAEIMAKASAGLVWITAINGGALDESERWAAHCLAALKQMGGHSQTEVQLYLALASARQWAHAFNDAHEALDRGLLAFDRVEVNRGLGRSRFATARGRLLFAQGRYEEALARFEDAGTQALQVYGADHPQLASALDDQGSALARLGQSDRALQLQLSALNIRRAALGETSSDVAGSHQNISVTLLSMGDLDAALKHARLSANAAEVLWPHNLELVSALTQLAAVLAAQEDYEVAVRHLERGLAIAVDVGGPKHPAALQTRFQLANLLIEAGQPARGRALLEDVVRAIPELHGPKATTLAYALRALAGAQLRDGDGGPAVAGATRALAIAVAEADLALVAGCRFLLARALVVDSPEQLPRARGLARQARDYYVDADPDEAAAVVTWLSER